MSLLKGSFFIKLSEQGCPIFGRLDSFRASNENINCNEERQLFFATLNPTLGARGARGWVDSNPCPWDEGRVIRP